MLEVFVFKHENLMELYWNFPPQLPSKINPMVSYTLSLGVVSSGDRELD